MFAPPFAGLLRAMRTEIYASKGHRQRSRTDLQAKRLSPQTLGEKASPHGERELYAMHSHFEVLVLAVGTHDRVDKFLDRFQ